MEIRSSKSDPPSRPPVLIAGAGPAGLFLGCCLERLGIEFLILEKNPVPAAQTRAIGIHPPSLEMLERLSLAERIIARGVRVYRGHAHGARRRLGTISFEAGPGPFNFVLSVPQRETEAALAERLAERAPGRLIRGAAVEEVEDLPGGLRVRCRGTSGGVALGREGALLAGCDGKRSRVREAAGIDFHGGEYADSFIMGDFPDSTPFGSDAHVFLGPEGLVESFPLPGERRRWVLLTGAREPDPGPERFCEAVRRRTGIRIDPDGATELSAFTAERYLAETFRRGRIALAGDAAHVLSPIGGQGMNLGWMDAWDLAAAIEQSLEAGGSPAGNLDAYARRARRRALRAARRAEFNMSLGRKSPRSHWRNLILALFLRSPARRRLRKMFTMRGLGCPSPLALRPREE